MKTKKIIFHALFISLLFWLPQNVKAAFTLPVIPSNADLASRFELSTEMTFRVKLDDAYLTSGTLVAYIGDEIRGAQSTAVLFPLTNQLIYKIIVYNDKSTGSSIKFRYFDTLNQKIYNIKEEQGFVPDLVPDYKNPGILTAYCNSVEKVSGMLPEDKQENLDTTVDLYWKPSANVSSYQLYLWEEGKTVPSSPYLAGITNTTAQIKNLNYGQTYLWKVVSANDCSSVESDVQSFKTIQLPDLVISEFKAPSTVESASNFSVSFNVKNSSSGNTLGTKWYDALYLSKDQSLSSDDQLVGAKENINQLKANDSYTQTFGFSFPLETSGDYYFIAKPDNNNSVPELSEENNVFVATNLTHVVLKPLPDVSVKEITAEKTIVTPGDLLNINWKVTNSGNAVAKGGWTEQISFIPTSGTALTFDVNTGYSNDLATGTTISRSSKVKVPEIPGFSGEVTVKVELIPSAELIEYSTSKSNNVALSGSKLTVEKVLYFDVQSTEIPENLTTPIRCSISLSGETTSATIVSLTTSASDRIKVPVSVTIPAGNSGQVFYINAIDNQVLDVNSSATISATTSGYKTVSKDITIVDNEIPKLKVSASKTNLNEGDQFALTVERELVNASPLQVYLKLDYSKRFSFSQETVIPANQKSISVDVVATDDAIPALTVQPVFTATAFGYTEGTCSVTLADNDVPVISLAVSPETISESGGYMASVGVVKRQGSTDNVITIKLTDDSNGALYYSLSTITLEKGESEKQFTIGIVDNALVDGTRTATITAAVYIASCSCSASGSSAGVVQSKLTILDNDGPTLKLVSSQTMLPEGKSEATVLTITRNTSATQALTVNLSSDHDSDLTYEKTVTIPAGSTSVSMPVSTKSNTTSEGDRTVTFSATTQGFTKGVCWAMLTDQTLADATVSVLSVSKDDPFAKDLIEAKFRVSNAGVVDLLAHTSVDIYLCNKSVMSSSDVKKLLTTIYTSQAIKPLSHEDISSTLELPDLTGPYYLVAEVNAAQSQKELSFLNNVSEALSLTLLPAYSVEVSPDKKIYKQDEQIILSGKAVGNGASTVSGVPVEVYVINNGYRQALSATTDNTGAFQVEYKSYSGQMGHFIAGGCYPGEALTTEKTSFDIYGLKRTSSDNLIWEIYTNEPKTGEIELTNPGNLPLTNLKTSIQSQSADWQLAFDPVSNIAAGETVKLKYTITGTAVSSGSDYEKIKFQVSSAEGASLDLTAYYYCRSQQASLKPSIAGIETTMCKGAIRNYQFTVSNTGKGSTGKITLSLPKQSWLSLVTPEEMPALAYGESQTVMLQLSPGEDLPANVPISGSIGINCENGSGISLPFRIETVSQNTGTLEIDVCDEYTFNTEAAPHLLGALVKIKHPYTNDIIAQGTTDNKGLYFVENLNEGDYIVEVTADKHGSYQNKISIEPGKILKEIAFIPFQAITYRWDVISTTIEDKYEISLVTKFETNVPKPVVLIDVPKEFPNLAENEEFAFVVKMTNTGLITAKNVELNFPTHKLYEFSTTYQPTDIPAQSTISALVVMQHRKNTLKSAITNIVHEWDRAESDVTQVFCGVYYLTALYFYICGDDAQRNGAVTAMNIPEINDICVDDGGGPVFDFLLSNNVPMSPNLGRTNGPTNTGTIIDNPIERRFEIPCWRTQHPVETKSAKIGNNTSQNQQSVCATVSVKFSQTLTMTREAFKGTLVISNGSETSDMQNIKLDMQIRDGDGVIQNGLFQINTLSMDKISAIDGTGTLKAMETGNAVIQFIPEKGAAPVISKSYSFGGTLSYIDPFTGVLVTQNLLPVTLTVKPSPDLTLDYFVQRDVLGDDPLTADVEVSEPAEFSLLINNKGAGDATNVRFSSKQPEITANAKGLAIKFNMIGSSLNGAATSVGLTDINFGTIAAGKTSYGQWWFTSSLLGHFIDYDTKITHVTSYDNPDLSLVSAVSAHELIHTLKVGSVTGFLVNDLVDSEDDPDRLYLTDGNTYDVSKAVSSSIVGDITSGNHELKLTVNPAQKGWNYQKITDPGNGKYKIVSVTRNDGVTIPLDNVWQTSVTLKDVGDPVHENKIHLADEFATTDAQTYTIRFELKDTDVLEVVRFENIPDDYTTKPVTSVNVVFNKPIDASTFDFNDISLKIQGEEKSDASIVVSPIDDVTYKIDFTSKSAFNGYYILAVQTSDINDVNGINGLVGKSVDWTQFLDVPAITEFSGVPEKVTSTLFNSILVKFNMAIDPTTLTSDRLTLKQGETVNRGTITITSMDTEGKLFQLSGFKTLASLDGNYSLSVDLSKIKSKEGKNGISEQTAKWAIDTKAPEIQQITPLSEEGLDEQHLVSFDVLFDEAVSGFNSSSIELWKDSEKQTLSSLVLTKKSDQEYVISGFGQTTYSGGNYQLKINLTNITDEAGNSSSNVATKEWVVKRTPPQAVTNLHITPDLGFSASDNITSTPTLSVSMTVNESDSQIKLYLVNQSEPVLLKDIPNAKGGSLSVPVDFIYSGNLKLQAQCIDKYGNKATTEIPFTIDETALVGSWKDESLSELKAQPQSLQIEFTDKLLDDSKLNGLLTFKRDGQSLETKNLVIAKSSDKVYQVSGLSSMGNSVGNYTLALDVSKLQKYSSGKEGISSATIQWSIANSASVANAGADQTVNKNSLVTLDGSGSTDPNNDALTYLWTAPDGITLSSATIAKPTFTAPEVNSDKTFTFSLIVNDGTVNSIADHVVITVKANQAPTANAGPDKSVMENSSVTLDGSGSSDPDNNTITYKWIAPSGITLSSATVAKPTFTAPEVSSNTNYTFTLVVNDGTLDSPADQVVITVKQENKAPYANAGTNQSINENSLYTLDGSSSYDPDSDPLTYKWTGPIGVTLSSATVAKPTFTAPEVTIDTDFIFTLVTNDGVEDSQADQVKITVRQVNKAPVANAGPDQIVDEGSVVSLNGSTSTDTDGDQLSYNWTAPVGITLSSATSATPTFTAPDVKQDTQCEFSLKVFDGNVYSTEDKVVITVKKVNKAPVANAGADQVVNEGSVISLNGGTSTDTDGDQLTYAWTAPVGITLSSATSTAPTFTAPEVAVDTPYTFTLVVSDGTATSTADQVIITVTQVNKVPVANAGLPQTVVEGTVVTLDGSKSTDADGDILTYIWTAPDGVTLSGTTTANTSFVAPATTTTATYTLGLTVNDGKVDSQQSTVLITVVHNWTSIPWIATSSLRLYPNPVSGPLTVDFGEENESGATVEVYGIQGGLQLQQKLYGSKATFDLSGLITGSYLVKIRIGEKVQFQLILKK